MSTSQLKQNDVSSNKIDKIDSDYANRNEIKRIDSRSDKSFSAEFDKLNESLYKINSFLKLSKEIDDLKKENLVKNDIQRKLSLKSQWLNSNPGSTVSLNSLPPANFRKDSIGDSTQSLLLPKPEVKQENDFLKKKRKDFANFKSVSVQNLSTADKPRKRYRKHSNCTSFDELGFVNRLKLSDEELSQLSQEPDFQDSNFKSSKNSVGTCFSEKLGSTNRISDSKESLSKYSLTSSQRDLSKYFPKREVKAKPANVNKNQKELKDVDLSKYFLPSPVQELKSIPSPGQSPKLSRKPIKSSDEKTASTTNLLRTAMDNLQKMQKPPIDRSQEKSAADDARKQKFSMHNQQLDGEVSFNRQPINLDEPKSKNRSFKLKSAHASDDECEKLFDCLKSPTEDIDELFDKVAADVLPELPKQKANPKEKLKEKLKEKPKTKVVKKVVKKKIVEKPKIEKTQISKKLDTSKLNFAGELSLPKPYGPPAPKWTKKQSFLDENREEDILSKLSSNLLNEIKLLEKHLELNDKLAEPTQSMTAEELHQTEDDLNNAINDILKSVDSESNIGSEISFKSAVDNGIDEVDFIHPERKMLEQKREMPAVSKPQKVQYSEMQKPKRGIRSIYIPDPRPTASPKLNELPTQTTEYLKARRSSQTQTFENITKDIIKQKPQSPVKEMRKEFFADLPEYLPRRHSKHKEPHSPVVMAKHESVNVDSRKKPNSPTKEMRAEFFAEKSVQPKPLIENIASARKETNADSGYKPKSPAKSLRTEFSSDQNTPPDYTSHYRSQQNQQLPSENLKTTQNEAITNEEKENKSMDLQNSPPIKPIRRQRSRKSSLRESFDSNDAKGEQFTSIESSSNAQNRYEIELPNKEQQKRFTELNKIDEPKRTEEVPTIKTIAQMLNEHPTQLESKSVEQFKEPKKLYNENHKSNTNISFSDAIKPTKNVDSVRFNENHNKTHDIERQNETEIKRVYDPPMYQQNEMVASSSSGDYDNLPSTSRKVKLSETKQMSKSFDVPNEIDRDYDNVDAKPEGKPIVRKLSFDKKRNVTDMLLERSKHIHNKKQDFMNEKLVESNPYIKRMIEKETRYTRPAFNRSYISSIPSTRHYDYPSYSHTSSRTLQPTTLSMSSHLTPSIRTTTTTPSTSRGVLNMFRHQPSSSSKDSCIIS